MALGPPRKVLADAVVESWIARGSQGTQCGPPGLIWRSESGIIIHNKFVDRQRTRSDLSYRADEGYSCGHMPHSSHLVALRQTAWAKDDLLIPEGALLFALHPAVVDMALDRSPVEEMLRLPGVCPSELGYWDGANSNDTSF